MYQLLASVYSIFIAIAKMELTEFEGIFDNLIDRLYLVLGLVMLFRISFSLLNMLANPSKATDANTGGGAIAKSIFISIVMLVAAPFVFDLCRDAQRAIVNSGVLEKIIIGNNEAKLTDKSAGPSFSWNLFKSFYYPTQGSWQGLNKVTDAYNSVWDGETFTLFPLFPYVNDTAITYTPLISTIVGIGIMIYIIKFTFDVGIRAFKLLFLELIAPIPIIFYMDPSKGKSVFDKYKEEFISTYVSLFVRLSIIFLALLLSNIVMGAVTSAEGSVLFANPETGEPTLNGLSLILAKVVLVVAIYQFAISVPKLIQDVFGINLSGSTSLKGIGSSPLGKTAAFLGGGAIGAAVGTTGSLGSSLLRGDFRDENGKVTAGGVFKTAGNAISGGVRGGVGTAQAGWKSGVGKGTLGSVSSATTAGIRRQNTISEANRAAGGWMNMTKGRIDNALGGEYRAKRKMDSLSEMQEKASKNVQSAQTNMGAFTNMRSVAEREFAQQKGVSLDQARITYGSNFDNEVGSWIQTSGATNDKFQQVMENYNLENDLSGKAGEINVSSFANAESASRTQYVKATQDLNTAKAQESAYKSTDSALGTNKERAENRKAASNFDNKK
ncbi:MAG: hypothetical protein PHI32_15215, partial [Dysgonamonadaceae bacterium]|nr:hypothetical protein [Dysgonamonadaceae bacterium]